MVWTFLRRHWTFTWGHVFNEASWKLHFKKQNWAHSVETDRGNICSSVCLLHMQLQNLYNFFRHGYWITPVCPVSGFIQCRERMQVLSSECAISLKSCSWNGHVFGNSPAVTQGWQYSLCRIWNKDVLQWKRQVAPSGKVSKEEEWRGGTCRIWREKRRSPEGSDIVKTQHNCFCFLSMTVTAITNQSSLISHDCQSGHLCPLASQSSLGFRSFSEQHSR